MPTLSALAASQPRVVSVLTAALASRRLHHGYLFVEPEEGTGEALAIAMAGALVCQSPVAGDACGECAACRKHAGGNHPDVVVLRPSEEKGIITADAVREVSRRVSLKSMEGGRKVVLIVRVDLANATAQNSLLKTCL